MKENELILILDFGGQYNQLIARRVRECNVYSEVVPYNISIEKIKEKNILKLYHTIFLSKKLKRKTQKELFLQVDLQVYMEKIPLNVQKVFLI